MLKKLIFIFVIVFISACQAIKTQNQKQVLKNAVAELGTIGVITNSTFSESTFNPIGAPELTKKIRIQVTQIPFNKTMYKKYQSLLDNSTLPNLVVSNDSIAEKNPSYLEFTIIDLINLTASLNTPENSALQSYLDNNSNYRIISSIAVVAKASIYKDFLIAEEIYLTKHNTNKLGLELMKEGKLYKKINFAAFTSFDYTLSSFCWGKDNRNRPCIRAIINENASCPNKTYKKAYKLDKKHDFKF